MPSEVEDPIGQERHGQLRYFLSSVITPSVLSRSQLRIFLYLLHIQQQQPAIHSNHPTGNKSNRVNKKLVTHCQRTILTRVERPPISTRCPSDSSIASSVTHCAQNNQPTQSVKESATAFNNYNSSDDTQQSSPLY